MLFRSLVTPLASLTDEEVLAFALNAPFEQLARMVRSPRPSIAKARLPVDELLRRIRVAGFEWAFTAICMRHKTALRTVLEGGRTAHVTAARHEMWAHARAAGLTYPAIGALTGSDHTSVLNALRAAQVRAERNRVRCAAARRIA